MKFYHMVLKKNIYNIIKYIPRDTQICIFSATMPEDVLELTNKFMNKPEKILVNKVTKFNT